MILPPLADKARVVFTQTVQYIPRGLKGMIRCQTSANPPIKYITWTKDNRLFQPFKTAGIQALLNGSLLIDQVSILLVKYRDEEIYLRKEGSLPYNCGGATNTRFLLLLTYSVEAIEYYFLYRSS